MRISPSDPLAARAKPAVIQPKTHAEKVREALLDGRLDAASAAVALQTPSQRRGEHWRTKADRAKAQRSKMRRDVGIWLDANGPILQITVTRIAPRRLDEPNLGQALKHAIDGLSDALRIDDGSRAVRWVLQQRKGQPAVEFTIEAIP